METLDWRTRRYEVTPFEQGQRISIVCWSDDGRVPTVDDYLILRNGTSTGTRYQVSEVRRALAEGDVVTVRAKFSPRHEEVSHG